MTTIFRILAGTMLGGALACAGGTAMAQAAAEPIPVEEFARATPFTDLILSPDGRHVALTNVKDGVRSLYVLDATRRTPLRGIRLPEQAQYEYHRWAGNGTVLVSVSQKDFIDDEEVRFTRLFALDIATGKQWPVGGARSMGIKGDDILWVAPDGSHLLLSFQRNVYEWPMVYRVSLLDSEDRGTLVQRDVPGVWDWYADDAGVVRMGTGWLDKRKLVMYRSGPDDRLRTIARVREDEIDENWWEVARIYAGSDEALVLDEEADGRVVLARFNLATRTPVARIHRNEQWDIDSALLARDGSPLAVEFTDTRDRRVWLTPEMATLQSRFEKALKADEVWIGSRSADGQRMLVHAGGESDPGLVYLYDAPTKNLTLFTENRPGASIDRLARPRPVTYRARDGMDIPAFLTLPPGREAKGLPLIVMPHGGPYGIRDRLTYDDDVQVLASRGYAVLQPNYRGSGGYGAAFENAGDGQIGRKMQDDLDDAMDWAVAQGFADRNRVCMVGASYGGYAAIWAVIRNPERYRCAASFAGVTDWRKILAYDSKFLSTFRNKQYREQVRGEKDFDLDSVAPAQTIDRLTRPLLVAQGKKDTIVPYSQYKILQSAAARAGKPVEWLVFEDEGHGFDKPENKLKWYQTLLDFLARHNPA